jgi:peptidoglycan/LPS O-acetylase OafA/YrhL
MYGQGGVGVLLFFMLSGFVLTLPFATHPARIFEWSTLWRFFVNRSLRVVPAFYVAVYYTAWYLGRDWEWIGAHLSFLSGWAHFWSVVQEARFYVLFPVTIAVLAFMPRALQIPALVILVLVAWIGRKLHAIDTMESGPVEFYFWIFVTGILVCFLYKKFGRSAVARQTDVARFFSAAAIVATISIVLTADEILKPIWPGAPPLNAWSAPELWCGLFAMLLFNVTVYPQSIIGRGLQSWFVCHLGLLSYSLYLFHIPVSMHLRALGMASGTRLFVATFCITYIAACISYLVVEKPFLALKPTSSFRSWVGPFVLKVALLISVIATPAMAWAIIDNKDFVSKQSELRDEVAKLEAALEKHEARFKNYPQAAGDMPIGVLEEKLASAGLTESTGFWSSRASNLYVSDGKNFYGFQLQTEKRANVFSPRIGIWCLAGQNVKGLGIWGEPERCPWD